MDREKVGVRMKETPWANHGMSRACIQGRWRAGEGWLTHERSKTYVIVDDGAVSGSCDPPGVCGAGIVDANAAASKYTILG